MRIFFGILLLSVSLSTFSQTSLSRGTGSDIPIGSVITFAGSVCPFGYLEANGNAISRSTYAKLHAVMSNHGNGNGTTTFNLPDYRGKFLRMIDGLAGQDVDKAARTAMNPGGAIGNLVGSIQSDEVKSHAHTYITPTKRTQQNAVDDGYSHTYQGWQGSTTAASYSTGGTETRPKNAYVLYCVKY